MQTACFYNGIFASWDKIAIPLSDRGIFFGDGVYDACIGKNKTVYLLDEHLERFFANLAYLSIHLGYSKEELKKIISELTYPREGEFFLYFQATRELGVRAHACPKGSVANLLIYVSDFNLPDIDTKLSLITYPDLRYGYCNIKTLNLLPNTLAATKAKELGCDEAIFIRDSYVTECAHSNLAIIVGNTLYTHPLDCRILPGISRAHLLNTARELGMCIREKPFEKHELYIADAVLISSTSKLCLPASQIDGIKIGCDSYFAKQIIKRMREEFVLAVGG